MLKFIVFGFTDTNDYSVILRFKKISFVFFSINIIQPFGVIRHFYVTHALRFVKNIVVVIPFFKVEKSH